MMTSEVGTGVGTGVVAMGSGLDGFSRVLVGVLGGRHMYLSVGVEDGVAVSVGEEVCVGSGVAVRVGVAVLVGVLGLGVQVGGNTNAVGALISPETGMVEGFGVAPKAMIRPTNSNPSIPNKTPRRTIAFLLVNRFFKDAPLMNR